MIALGIKNNVNYNLGLIAKNDIELTAEQRAKIIEQVEAREILTTEGEKQTEGDEQSREVLDVEETYNKILFFAPIPKSEHLLFAKFLNN